MEPLIVTFPQICDCGRPAESKSAMCRECREQIQRVAMRDTGDDMPGLYTGPLKYLKPGDR